MVSALQDVIQHQKAGEAVGVTSICSAHPLVLEAAIAPGDVRRQLRSHRGDVEPGRPDRWLCGMRPADFRELGFEAAIRCGLPWNGSCSEATISGQTGGGTCPPTSHAAGRGPRRRLRRRGIHQDPSGLQHALRRRPAVLARRPGRAPVSPADAGRGRHRGDTRRGRYAVLRHRYRGAGPRRRSRDHRPPGADIPPTRARGRPSKRTEARFDERVSRPGLVSIALVVQPGVEFDHLSVIDYARGHRRNCGTCSTASRTGLRGALDRLSDGRELRALVEDHWAVLKVGPGLDVRDAGGTVRAGHDRGGTRGGVRTLAPRRGRRAKDARRTRAVAEVLPGRRRGPSAWLGGTATATGCGTTGPTQRSTRLSARCSTTSPGGRFRCP